jgi:hypothetical protein
VKKLRPTEPPVTYVRNVMTVSGAATQVFQPGTSPIREAIGQMGASRIRMSVEQSLTPEASEIAIKGTAVRSGAKPTTHVVRFKEPVKMREDLQNFPFRNLCTQEGRKLN